MDKSKFIISQNFSGCRVWLSIFVVAILFLSIAILLINGADYFADNIKFLLDDPYIYWTSGWILFVVAFIAFSVSGINIVQKCLQYFKNKKFENVISEE